MKTNAIVSMLIFAVFLLFIVAVFIILAIQEAFSSLFSRGDDAGNAGKSIRKNTLAPRLP